MKALYISSDRAHWNKFISFFREHLNDVELFCAKSSSDAIDIIIHESPIGIIIIDDQLIEKETQIELAQEILESSGQKPILFLSPQNLIKEILSHDFFKSLETNKALEKPYTDEGLKAIIQESLSWNNSKAQNDVLKKVDDQDYVPIKLKNFYLYDKVAYDVYYLVYPGNYMKVITKDKKYSESIIQNLARKNIKDLYLLRTEKIKFLEESMEKAIKILSDKNAPIDKYITTQMCGVFLIHEIINEVGVTESTMLLAEKIVQVTPKVYDNYNDFFSFLKNLPITSGDAGEQAIFMLYLSFAVSLELDWGSELTIKKLGLACLIHDCKLQNDSLSLIQNTLDPRFDSLSNLEVELFNEHAIEAEKVSLEFSNFPDCGFIIREHHTLPEKRYTHTMNSISCLFTIIRSLTTHLNNKDFSQMAIQQNLPKLCVYDFSGNFKIPYDALINLFTKV